MERKDRWMQRQQQQQEQQFKLKLQHEGKKEILQLFNELTGRRTWF